MSQILISLGALNAGLAVVLGAFGAHVLAAMLTPARLNVYQKATHYHLIHALGVIAIGILAKQTINNTHLLGSGGLLLLGIILFSGSLYALSLNEVHQVVWLTPIGGICFVAGCLGLAWATWSARDD